MADKVTTIDLVRHGEVLTPGLFCASPDEPLSNTGIEQLSELRNTVDWDVIVSSPQRRCREFAEQLSRQQHISLEIKAQWREMNFGRWVGQPYESVWKSEQEHIRKLWADPLNFTAPDGDTMAGFIARVQIAWTDLLRQHRGQHILLLTHAGVIRSILAMVLDINYHSTQKFEVSHGKINRIKAWPDGETSLVHWGCPASFFRNKK